MTTEDLAPRFIVQFPNLIPWLRH